MTLQLSSPRYNCRAQPARPLNVVIISAPVLYIIINMRPQWAASQPASQETTGSDSEGQSVLTANLQGGLESPI